MRTRRSEGYISKIIELEEFWSTIMIPKLYGDYKKIGNNNENGYKKETRIYVWSLCRIEIKKEKITID
jgi:hypothetical protein